MEKGETEERGNMTKSKSYSVSKFGGFLVF